MRIASILSIWPCLFLLGGVVRAEYSGFPELTNIAQLPHLPRLNSPVNYSVRLEGDVFWVSPASGKIVLSDGSGAALLEMDWRGQALAAGQRVRVTGNATVTQTGGSYRLGVHGAVVENDGVHGTQEKSGAIFLKAGRHPLRLDWFNGLSGFVLQVEYSGPNLLRQTIPDAALFRLSKNNPATNELEHGLDFECFDQPGNMFVDAEQRRGLKTGIVNNFDLGVRSRNEHIGITFSGLLAVPQDGLYTFFTRSDDGCRLFVDAPSLSLEVIGTAEFPTPLPLAIGQTPAADCQWVQVSGMATFASKPAKELEIELRSATGLIRVLVADAEELSPADLLGKQLQATGVCVSAYTTDGQKVASTLLVVDGKRLSIIAAPLVEGTNSLPVLKTAGEVHRLKREEAQRGYPVKIRGVVTCVLPDNLAITIQDATRGLFVLDLSPNRSRLPAIGDFVEVKGVTDPSSFAPVVNASELTDLGAGHLPEPVRPTWDQLLNGSLDAQYVELQGIITAVNTNGVTLLTREGRINLELRVPGMSSAALARYEGALVRLRGSLFANWDYLTHEVKAGEVRIYGASISVEQPAPEDLFATPAKTAGELLLFDPQAGVFQRVKVSGQILHRRDAECFMTDGRNGLRFIAKKPLQFSAGDMVEVVGFPELSGVSPMLLEAVARKMSHAPLPAVTVLASDNLIRAQFDSTWVQVNGVLVSVRETPTEQLLEIQNGLRTFVARLSGGKKFASSLPIGCQLELTGVYSGQGGNKAVGQEISSFELLLNNPADIKVLARPPWWNLQRLLFIVGALACVLAIAGLWITQLHRKVEARTAELEIQIKERQRVEQQRTMEQERARVAQDLHDELGSSLTEIAMLAARTRSAGATDERWKHYLEQMSDKAREIVVALDEIVWAMNPRHDSLASLVSYFSLYADRFLGLANISWRLEDAPVPPDFAVDSRYRHQLFLAFKEALTNVVRHSRATEVKLRFGVEAGEVRLTIQDNGCGLQESGHTENMDGVANMKARVEKLGGRFELESESGRGTTLRFCLPVNKIL